MYILNGTLKKKKIFSPKLIRPVSFRVKRACFSILDDVLRESIVLDLFAGSGALGIEALSLGAKKVIFVDINKVCVNTILKNLKNLDLLDKGIVYKIDAFSAIKKFFEYNERFDILFLDPPYSKGIFRKILQNLEVYDILNPFGYIIGFCHIKDEFFEKVGNFFLILKRNYGQTLLLIYKKNE